MSDKGNLEARKWASGMLGLSAAILAFAAVLTLPAAPLGSEISLDWTRSFAYGLDRIDSWALFLAPAVLVVIGLAARLGKILIPGKMGPRHVLWTALTVLILIAAAGQYLLVRDAFQMARGF
ncbi:hypothetical protein [Paracoccus aminophilus]|uniref:hypothetical protein n=1 Tax=Paracoccus aminophilus TaxID=34003 RepID=UPI0004068440|nr:hypothetical protein [Paracoccus aminophilus]